MWGARSAWVAVTVVAGCGAPARTVDRGGAPRDDADGPTPTSVVVGTPVDAAAPPAPAYPPPPTDFARADFVTLAELGVVAYAASEDRVTRLGSAALLGDPELALMGMSGDWIDRERFAFQFGDRDVVTVTAREIVPLPVPPKSAFAAPRPADATQPDDLEQGGVMDDRMGLVVADDGAWWVECPWGYSYDGWECETWRAVRLWPEASGDARAEQVKPRRWTWPKVDVPGYRVEGAGGDGADAYERLRCRPPGKKGKPTTIARDDEPVYGWRWVSASPARLMVVYASEGLGGWEPGGWSLHDGCAPTPLAHGEAATPGPSGLWVGALADDGDADGALADEDAAGGPPDDGRGSDDGPRHVVYRGGTLLGTVRGEVRFRPLAP